MWSLSNCLSLWTLKWILTWRQPLKLCMLVTQSCLTTPSVQFSHSVVSDSLRPHELQHARPPCPSPTPRVYSNPCPLSQWCHPAISSSVFPFSSCPQSLPASGSFPVSQLFAWGGQSTGVYRLYEKAKRTIKDELHRSVGAQYAAGEQWRNNSKKNEEMEPKQKQHPVVDVIGDGSKVQCYKEQYS